MNTKIIFVILMLFAVAGCENDIDLKADDTTGLLCVNGYLIAGADNNYVTVALTGKDSPKGVTNAKVVVSVNGSVVETIDGVKRDDMYLASDNWDYNFYKVSASFNPGDYVQVDVYYDNQHAYGGGTVPQPIKDGKVEVEFEADVPYKSSLWSTNYSSANMSMVEVTITDIDPDSKNYYRMAVTQSDSVKMRIDEKNHFLSHYSWRLQDASSDEYELSGHYDSYRPYEYYFDNDPILSAEVVKSQGDISFVDAVDNIYKIFTDNFFNGSTATLHVMMPLYYDWQESYHPAKYYFDDDYDYWDLNELLHEIDYYAPRYTHRNYVDVYSISDDEYYYLKVLNARGPGSYFEWDDSFSLTGDVKLPSNVKGGTGNIFVSSCARFTGAMFEDYVPEFGGKPSNRYYFK